MSILDFDYEEKAGVDAIRLQYYLGPISKAELAVRPGADDYDRTWAGLWSVQFGGYDLFVIAAEKNRRRQFGGAWSGAVGDAGFRGEFKRSAAPRQGLPTSHPTAPVFGSSLYDSSKEVDSLVLSLDYTFASSFYTHTECLYQSNGKSEYAAAFALQATDADMPSPARWSLFQEFAYDLTPLWRISIFVIRNMDDSSQITSPTLNWSAATNLDLTVTAFISSGNSLSEWGNTPDSMIARVKYAF